MQESWRAVQAIHSSIDATDFLEPPELTRAADDLRDNTYFLLLTSHHALVTAPRRAISLSLPEPTSALLVTKLRDVYEHWQQWLPTEIDPDNPRPWAGQGTRSKSGRFLGNKWPRA